MVKSSQSVTFVQYSGDFADTALRLGSGGKETYRAQRYTVEFVERLIQKFAKVSVVTAFTPTAYDVMLPSGVRAIGAGLATDWDTRLINSLVASTTPDRVVLRTPILGLLRGTVRLRVPTIAMLADSFHGQTLKDVLMRALIVHYLNAKCIEIVGNHGRNAARQLVEAGVRKDKVLAYDYPAVNTPSERPAKDRAAGNTVIYVGMLMQSKGVDDLLNAAASLKRRGTPVRLRLIGEGDRERLASLVSSLGLSDVEFLGKVPNDQIIGLMSAADAVVVPSRHDYPEGLPLTLYEALCSRTPLVVSDHPMFVENIVHEESGLVFKAGDSEQLAAALSRLLTDEAIYASLSSKSEAAWSRMQIENMWGQVIEDWLDRAAAR